MLTFEESIPLLASPDTGSRLELLDDKLVTDSGGEKFDLVDNLPLLFPSILKPFVTPTKLEIPESAHNNRNLQYFYISTVKMFGGDHNIPPDGPWYKKHLDQARNLLADARGIVLDVGCDDPGLSASLLPDDTRYLGVDPLYENTKDFRIIGLAEKLPIQTGSVDCVSLLTSLDHVFDWHAALDNAWRVLREGGSLYLASLVWKGSADLFQDDVHFHHFREDELLLALSHRFEVELTERYDWKGDQHRCGLYLKARALPA